MSATPLAAGHRHAMVPTAGRATWLDPAPGLPAWLERGLLALVVAAWAALVAVLAVREPERRFAIGPLPVVADVQLSEVWFDNRPVALTVTAGWAKIPHVATRDQVRSDITLWRRMNVEDWDTVPAPLRGEAFDAMLTRYDGLLASPSAWDRMGPVDWDPVPQPIRAMAFRHMAEYWSGYYQLGAAHGIPRKTMADTLAAVIMSESWFEHRAVNANGCGNRDIGVAQASDATRRRMTTLHRTGRVDVLLEEADYFDPWKGVRFAAIWVGLLLDEANGDLDLAIAAYHRGIARAREPKGEDYHADVLRRLRRYIRNEEASAAWDDLWRRDATRMAVKRPWLRPVVGTRRSSAHDDDHRGGLARHLPRPEQP